MLTPTTESDLAEAIRSADGPLSIQGGGTHGISFEGAQLTTSGLSGITTYEPGALTIVAKSGTPLDEIKATLAAENQMLAFEPMDHRSLQGTKGASTIGGVVATNTSGPRRVQAGACRDFLLGVRFVDGSGNIIQNGGRVMKNVTGYDLARMQCGAHGTLGVLSEVSLKVLPKPETANSLLINGLDLSKAIEAMSSALTSPYEVTGAAHTMSGLGGDPVTMLRIEGFEDSVKYRVGKLKDRLASFGDIQVETRQDGPESVSSGWRWVCDVEGFTDKTAVWCLSMKASEVASNFGKFWETLKGDVLLDWGGGRVWVAADEDQLMATASFGGQSADPIYGATETHNVLQDQFRFISGHATLIKGPKPMRDKVSIFQPEVEPLAKLAAGLREKFDPRGILNPGLMG